MQFSPDPGEDDVPGVTGVTFRRLEHGYPTQLTDDMYMATDNQTHPLFLYLHQNHWIISDKVRERCKSRHAKRHGQVSMTGFHDNTAPSLARTVYSLTHSFATVGSF